MSCVPHPAAVPGLGLSLTASGNAIMVGLDLSHSTAHVRVPAVTPLDDDRGVRDVDTEDPHVLWGQQPSTSPIPSRAR